MRGGGERMALQGRREFSLPTHPPPSKQKKRTCFIVKKVTSQLGKPGMRTREGNTIGCLKIQGPTAQRTASGWQSSDGPHLNINTYIHKAVRCFLQHILSTSQETFLFKKELFLQPAFFGSVTQTNARKLKDHT